MSGSTHIRVNQLLKYWPEAELYKYGDNPDVLILQKVYMTQDYRFPANFPNKKILDVCDPDWMGGLIGFTETARAVDAVTCPTEPLAKFIRQLTDKPVKVIPDRFDVELVPEPKSHTEPAHTVVWFGYRHNAEVIRPAMKLIYELGLKLIVIGDDDPMPWQWLPPEIGRKFRYDNYKFIKHEEDSIYYDLQRADFALLPKGTRPVDPFKSNNKPIRALLAGLPVAYTSDDVKAFLDADNRQAVVEKKWKSVKEEYDVRNSVKEYKELIATL